MLQVGKVADPGDVAAKAGSAASKAKSSVKQEANGAGGNPLGAHLPAATSLCQHAAPPKLRMCWMTCFVKAIGAQETLL